MRKRPPERNVMDLYWLEQTAEDVPECDDWLGECEANRLNAMRFLKRRADSRLGRWTAKCAIAVHLNMPIHPQALAAIEIRPTPSGAPEVFVANRQPNATISLSHRAAVALCVVAPVGTAVGCDLEVVEPRSEAFISDYFTDEEQAFIAGASGNDQARVVALLWSAKESALKALREGLRLDTRSVAVSLDARAFDPAQGIEEWLPLLVRYTADRVFRGWWQQTGKFVRTLVADPAPGSPILLQIPAETANRAAFTG